MKSATTKKRARRFGARSAEIPEGARPANCERCGDALSFGRHRDLEQGSCSSLGHAARTTSRWGVASRAALLMTATAAVAVLPSCGGRTVSEQHPAEREEVEPIQQNDGIPIQVQVGDKWVTVHASPDGAQHLMFAWCDRAGEDPFDAKLCSEPLGRMEPDDRWYGHTDNDGQAVKALCHLRRRVCAGAMMRELGTSPATRVLDGARVGGGSVLWRAMGVSEDEIRRAGLGAGAVPTKIKFEGLAGTAKAAALQGAMKSFAGAVNEATRIRRAAKGGKSVLQLLEAHDMKLTGSAPNNSALSTALSSPGMQTQGKSARRVMSGSAPDGMGGEGSADPSEPKLTDTYYETLASLAMTYQDVVKETVEATIAAGDASIGGSGSLDERLATQWKGAKFSRLAAVRLLTAGDWYRPSDKSHTKADSLSWSTANYAKLFNLERVPVCPSISMLAGVQKAVDLLRQYPHSDMDEDPLHDPAEGFADEWRAQNDQPDMSTSDVLAHVGLTAQDIRAAKTYLRAEVQVTGASLADMVVTKDSNSLFGRGFVTRGTTLPPQTRAAYTLGATTNDEEISVDDPAYADGGAIRTLETIGVALSEAEDNPVVSDDVKEITESQANAIKIKTGPWRLEAYMGHESEDEYIDRVHIELKGIEVDAGNLPVDRWLLVQGKDSLKCVLYGKVDDAPCVSDNLAADLSAGLVHDVVEDSGRPTKAISFTLQNIHHFGNPGVGISPYQALFVVRVQEHRRSVEGGVTPIPGGGDIVRGDGYHYTSHVSTPLGGSMGRLISQLVETSVDDCSKPKQTCVGLPSDLWPPMQSEINGAQSGGPNYEASWKHYLQLARQSADEADRLGEDLVQTGLRMDERIQASEDKLSSLCGSAGSSENGCGGPPDATESLPYVTLGDKPVCIWELDGIPCNCPKALRNSDNSCMLECPFVPDAEDEESSSGESAENGSAAEQLKSACQVALNHAASSLPDGAGSMSNAHAIPVTEYMNLGASTPPSLSGCKALSQLRAGTLPPGTSREDLIRQLAKNWTLQKVARISKSLKYIESEFDNYELKKDGATIFRTYRLTRPSDNNLVPFPCTELAPGKRTGSDFWDTGIKCFESGKGTCKLKNHVGFDGCPIDWNHDPSTLSMDTEPAALRARWAWGFGHLRRSMAALGVMTGTLNGRMQLANLASAAGVRKKDGGLIGAIEDYVNMNELVLVGNPRMGDLAAPRSPLDHQDPPWWYHNTPMNRAEFKDAAQCVTWNERRDNSPYSDFMKHIGRPVNLTMAFPNAVPYADWHIDLPAVAHPQLIPFPKTRPVDDDQGPLVAGLDPQFPYCYIPKQETNYSEESDCGGSCDPRVEPGHRGSAFVGASISELADSFPEPNTEYQQYLYKIWTPPGPSWSCSNPGDVSGRSAIWSSFCKNYSMESLGDLQKDLWFMTMGVVPGKHEVIWNKDLLGKWLYPGRESVGAEQMLFDQRYQYVVDGPTRFMYDLTRRNVVDAMELACAANQSAKVSMDCKKLGTIQVEGLGISQLSQVLHCYSSHMHAVASHIVAGPVPKVVVDSARSAVPLNGISGLGGRYLSAMVEQYGALVSIQYVFEQIAARSQDLAQHAAQIESIHRDERAQDSAYDWRQMANGLATAATVLRDASSASSSVLQGNVVGAVGSSGAAGLDAAAGAAQSMAMKYEKDSAKERLFRELSNELYQSLRVLREARTHVKELNLQINAFVDATARLDQIRAEAAAATADAKFSDYVGTDNESGARRFNTALRRTYHTKLVRYNEALARARRQAFIARRAIELRFGVDLTRMSADMTLVKPPITWANDVCTMSGIDYGNIRTAEPPSNTSEAGGDTGENSGTVAWSDPDSVSDSDQYAKNYVGEYVTKLEQFVRSYPFDFPLKDSEDTAVLSLTDDIFGLVGTCREPTKNRLFYATEFDRTSAGATQSGTDDGWHVIGCSLEQPGSPKKEPWTGCVSARPVTNSGSDAPAIPSVQVVPPQGATVYRLSNMRCDEPDALPKPGQDSPPTICPDAPAGVYLTEGAIAQTLDGLESGINVASVYVRRDDRTDFNQAVGPYNYQTGDHPVMRVTCLDCEPAPAIVASVPLPVESQWKRQSVSFSAVPGNHYRLELAPSIQNNAILSRGPSVLIAAAQVEKVNVYSDTDSVSATTWEYTDSDREKTSPVCHKRTPNLLRQKFAERCLYLCKSGLAKTCIGEDMSQVPKKCFHEVAFAIPLEDMETGKKNASGQLAVGNFNYRHNQVGVNLIGSGLASCDDVQGASCYGNGFAEYSLIHSGVATVRNWTGSSLQANMDPGVIEHAKALTNETSMTNPPSQTSMFEIGPYMKSELKGRPIQGSYILRIWDSPSLKWQKLEDVQLVWKYHYWTRASHQPDGQ